MSLRAPANAPHRLTPVEAGPDRTDAGRRARTIVQVGKYYAPVVGGIENNVRQLALACAEDVRSVAICMRKGWGPREESQDGLVRVVKLRSFGAFWRQEVVESPVAILQELAPDVVHFHTPNPLLAFPVLQYVRRNTHVSVVVSHHADLQRPLPVRAVANLATYQLLRRARAVICYTGTFAQGTRELQPFLDKVRIIPHGVPVPQGVARRRDGVTAPGRIRLGYLGRIEKWKGLQVVAEMLAITPGCDLIVAGDGGYRGETERLFASKGLSSRVRFIGQVEGHGKEVFFDSIDALVLPSLNRGESYGQVLVEAQLRGIPVIASDLPTGIREICDAGKAGLLFAPGSPVSLSACAQRLRDPDTYNAIALSGLERARSKYTEGVVRSAIVDLYRDLLQDPIPPSSLSRSGLECNGVRGYRRRCSRAPPRSESRP